MTHTQAEGFFSLCFSPSLNSPQILLYFLTLNFRGGSHYEHLMFLTAGLDNTLGLWILHCTSLLIVDNSDCCFESYKSC